jgi:hypothetical protein
MSEKRKTVRVPVNMTADLSNGTQVFADCDIINISCGGLLIDNIRKSLIGNKQSDICDIVVNMNNRCVKLKCRLKWFSKKDISSYVKAGFEIIDNPQNWLGCIEYLLPKTELDVWGNSGLKYMR